MIRFSVIIPLYNKANYVRKTIESVLSQTFRDFEIIIINDGSTDNSLAVVNEINDDRIHIFSKENGGVSAARNFGIEKALYEYITFLDADDLWLPDYLETIKGMIEQYPKEGVFTTSYTLHDNISRKDLLLTNLPKGKTILVENFCKSLLTNKIGGFCTNTICVKKALFCTAGGFREGIRRGEDLDMWLRLSLVSPIVWKNDTKAMYILMTENSTSSLWYSKQYDFPCWEWYAYGSSIYLKMYTNRMIKAYFSNVNLREKIYILSKFNWFYVLIHFFLYPVIFFKRKRGK